MTLHRFFIPPETIRQDGVSFPPDAAHQIARVLRLRPGDQVVVLDNSGAEWVVRLTTVTSGVEGEVEECRRNEAEPTVQLVLYQGLLKASRLEVVLQKCTEVGVSRFVPVSTTRSVVAEPGAGKQRRFEEIVREAAEQSRRGRVPRVSPPSRSMAGALREAAGAGPAVVLWEDERHRRLRSLQREAVRGTVSLFVGPEGGFSPEEIHDAQEVGAMTVTLGPRVLRAETAAIVGSALLLAHLDEAGPTSG